MIIHENRLPADDSHIIMPYLLFLKKSGKILNCRLLQTIGGALRVKTVFRICYQNTQRCGEVLEILELNFSTKGSSELALLHRLAMAFVACIHKVWNVYEDSNQHLDL